MGENSAPRRKGKGWLFFLLVPIAAAAIKESDFVKSLGKKFDQNAARKAELRLTPKPVRTRTLDPALLNRDSTTVVRRQW